jgi:hypothetical protein
MLLVYNRFASIYTLNNEKVEVPLAAAPVKFPPPIFGGSVSVSIFLCFHGTLL